MSDVAKQGPRAGGAEASLPCRVGLVLEGGGAKGAYSFGCLQAFAREGICFDAIAGTSVGALNAAIFAAGEMEFGEAYWSSIGHGKVYRPRLRGFLCLPLLLVRLLLYKLGQWTGIRGTTSGTVVMYILLGSAIMIVFSLVCWGLGALFAWEWGLGWRHGWIWFSVLPACMLSLMFLPGWLDRFGVALLVPQPLREQVARIAEKLDSTKTPVYATLCERKGLVDPDHVSVIVETTSGDQPAEETALLPVYLGVNDLPRADRINAVMASAALPMGVFPSISVNGCTYTDGGEVDNTPVYPLMSICPCDVIVVVRLRPTAGLVPDNTEAGYAKHWSICDRLIRLRGLGDTAAEAMIEERYGGDLMNQRTAWSTPRLFPRRDPDRTPKRIITIEPKESLGGFLSGTLNFSARKARQLLAQGQRDALAAIAELRRCTESAQAKP